MNTETYKIKGTYMLVHIGPPHKRFNKKHQLSAPIPKYKLNENTESKDKKVPFFGGAGGRLYG
ncbi:MAG: hypothetical protein KAS32_16085 [Candidatus Peribacteraceae bacterium]|nr:hypothetical protein [Candidatus Peribacteraceae bacterium]